MVFGERCRSLFSFLCRLIFFQSTLDKVPHIKDEREDRRLLVIRCRNNYTGSQSRHIPYHQMYFKDADLRLCNCDARKTP
ncbi:uncharacterized protein LOC102654482 isoform X2 [Apis mellifera]|uniref:Uncharacterized protein LOC102654482 isoform X2 n=1 Tax=Apis mellifera TaxID=7460 RepID=A0A7M7MLU8_APIME|nr:uncharacterized protein LOC102654482 isoform X2 [Apis mellifera]|eukprot:XP_026297788.1 uncharacterized protein LOC102654482 isoform X2 [Apis mellifera]